MKNCVLDIEQWRRIDGKVYQAVTAENMFCTGCAGYENDELCKRLLPCYSDERKDKTEVIWEHVPADEEPKGCVILQVDEVLG